MNKNVAIHRLSDPSTAWVFHDPFIAQAVIRQASRLLMGAAAERPEYPEFAGTVADPDLAREVVVLADGAMWQYADEVAQTIVTPGAVGICHKCGDRGRIEGVIVVGYKRVLVEFAFCVGCLASHVAFAERIAAAWDSIPAVAALTTGQNDG